MEHHRGSLASARDDPGLRAREARRKAATTAHVSRLSATFLRDLFRSQANRPRERANSEAKAVAHREIDNVRAAIVWALSSHSALAIGLELTADSAPLWFQLSLMPEYRQRVERALTRLQDHAAPGCRAGNSPPGRAGLCDLVFWPRGNSRGDEAGVRAGDRARRPCGQHIFPIAGALGSLGGQARKRREPGCARSRDEIRCDSPANR